MRQNGNVEVHYVDYGNHSFVAKSDLRAMKPEFMELPEQSVQCTLHGVSCLGEESWSEDEISKFTRMIMDKTPEQVLKVSGGGNVSQGVRPVKVTGSRALLLSYSQGVHPPGSEGGKVDCGYGNNEKY